MKEKYDFLIVGAGLYGCTCANLLHKAGASVMVIDKNNHLGGMCYSEIIDGIDVHKYGPHVFHTNNNMVWDYLNSFVTFRQFTHKALSEYQNNSYCWPINLTTINDFYEKNFTPTEAKEFIKKNSKYYCNKKPINFEEQVISMIGYDLYSAFVKDYTVKQWNISPLRLSSDLAKRFPVRFSHYDGYYNDYYQGVPMESYRELFKKMLIDIPFELNLKFNSNTKYNAENIIYTGPLDTFFKCLHGELEWRSLKFDIMHLNVQDYQGISTLQCPEIKYPWTRQIEYKHYHPFNKAYDSSHTIVTREYSVSDNTNPYYPIPDKKNQKLADVYRNMAAELKNVFFGGRLAEYKYYNMDEVILKAMNDCKNIYMKLR